MKKLISVFSFCALAACLFLQAACGDKGGTYYPGSGEMKANLETNGYTVTITAPDDKSGTHLSGVKDEEYIEFYWLDNVKDCEYFYRFPEENRSGCNSLVKLENDESFGNIVYCGTETAVNAAGIKVVKVKL